jgi:hypothetical protein
VFEICSLVWGPSQDHENAFPVTVKGGDTKAFENPKASRDRSEAPNADEDDGKQETRCRPQ